MYIFSLNKKLASLALAFILFFSNSVFAHAFETNFWTERKKSTQLVALPKPAFFPPQPLPHQRVKTSTPFATQNPLASLISPKFATVRNIYKPKQKSRYTVIHIQDVHMNQEAQKNIASVVSDVSKKTKVDLLALEGAFGSIDLSPFRKFPRQDVIEESANYLLGQNKISGAVLGFLAEGKDISHLVGVDDKKHYNANVQAYLNSFQKVSGLQQDLLNQKEQIQRQKNDLFHSDLLELDLAVQSYRNEKTSLGVYLARLKKIHNLSFPSIDMFLKAFSLESQLDIEKIEKERKNLVSQLISHMTEDETAELLKQSTLYRIGTAGQGQFHSYLKKLAKSKNASLSQYPSFEKYIDYLLIVEKLKAEKLFAEMEEYETKAFEALVKNNQQKDLVEKSRQLYLTSKLIKFSLTKREWMSYAPQQKALKSFEAFYKHADARDDAMAKNLLAAIKQHESKMTILVSGGYHSDGINKKLLDAGLNIVSVAPKISKVNVNGGTSYLSVFAQEKTPLEKMFVGEKLYVTQDPLVGLLLMKFLAVLGLLWRVPTYPVRKAFQLVAPRLSKFVRLSFSRDGSGNLRLRHENTKTGNSGVVKARFDSQEGLKTVREEKVYTGSMRVGQILLSKFFPDSWQDKTRIWLSPRLEAHRFVLSALVPAYRTWWWNQHEHLNREVEKRRWIEFNGIVQDTQLGLILGFAAGLISFVSAIVVFETFFSIYYTFPFLSSLLIGFIFADRSHSVRNREYLWAASTTGDLGEMPPNYFELSDVVIKFDQFDGLEIEEEKSEVENRMVLKNKFGNKLVIRHIKPKNKDDSFLVIGNRIYKLESATVDIFDLVYHQNLMNYLGNDQLLKFVDADFTSGSRQHDLQDKDPGVSVYLYDDLIDPPSRLSEDRIDNPHERLLPESIAPDMLDEVRGMLSHNFEQIVEEEKPIDEYGPILLHQLAILGQSQAFDQEEYAQTVQDRILFTKLLVALTKAHPTNGNSRYLDEIMKSVTLLAVGSRANQEQKKPVSPKKKNKTDEYVEFASLRNEFKEKVKQGGIRPYFIVNVYNFNPLTYLAVVDFLEELSREYNGHVTFLLAVQPAKVQLPGDQGVMRPYEKARPVIMTSRRLVMDTFGTEFYKKQHVANIVVGPKHSAGQLSIRYGHWGEIVSTNGQTYLGATMENVMGIWASLPNEGQDIRIALYGAERLEPTLVHMAGKPILELPDDFQFGLGGTVVDVLDDDTQPAMSKVWNRNPDNWSKIRDDKDFKDIEPSIRDTVDSRSLRNRVLFKADTGAEVQILEEEPTVEQIITMALSHDWEENSGRSVTESRLVVLQRAETDIKLVALLSQEPVKKGPEGFEARVGTRLTGSILKPLKHLREKAGIDKIHAISLGGEIKIEDPADPDAQIYENQIYLNSLETPKKENIQTAGTSSLEQTAAVGEGKSLLSHVQVDGNEPLKLGDRVFIRHSALRSHTIKKIPPQTQIIDSTLSDADFVSFNGYEPGGAVVIGVNFEPGQLKEGSTHEVVEKVDIYAGESLTELTFRNGDRFLVRRINGFHQTGLTIPELVGGWSQWDSIRSQFRLKEKNRAGTDEFWEVLTKPLHQVIHNDGEWQNLTTMVFAEILPRPYLIAARKEMQGAMEISNQAEKIKEIAKILYSLPSLRPIKLQWNDVYNEASKLVTLLGKTDSTSEIEELIQASYRTRFHDPILSVIKTRGVSYLEVKNLSYGEALFNVLAAMHPKVLGIEGVSSWKDVYRLEESDVHNLTMEKAMDIQREQQALERKGGPTFDETRRGEFARYFEALNQIKRKYLLSLADLRVYGKKNGTNLNYLEAREFADDLKMRKRTAETRAGTYPLPIEEKPVVPVEENLEGVEMSHVYALQLAGGLSSRLWPINKIFLDIFGDGVMLVFKTFLRAINKVSGIHFIAPNRFFVVTMKAFSEKLFKTLNWQGQTPKGILEQPDRRGTMGAFLWMMAHVEDPEAIIVNYNSDHVINDEEKLRKTVKRAVKNVQIGGTKNPVITLIGLESDSVVPEDTPRDSEAALKEWGRWGTIQAEPGETRDNSGVFEVTTFVEKPDVNKAREIQGSESLNFFNSGMVVARKDVLVQALAQVNPDWHSKYLQLEKAIQEDRSDDAAKIFESLDEKIRHPDPAVDKEVDASIDYILLMPLTRRNGFSPTVQVQVVRSDFKLTDVGIWSAVSDLPEQRKDQSGNYKYGNVHVDASVENSVIYLESNEIPGNGLLNKRKIEVNGLQDVVVVQSADGRVLVTKKERSNDVGVISKEAIKAIEQSKDSWIDPNLSSVHVKPGEGEFIALAYLDNVKVYHEARGNELVLVVEPYTSTIKAEPIEEEAVAALRKQGNVIFGFVVSLIATLLFSGQPFVTVFPWVLFASVAVTIVHEFSHAVPMLMKSPIQPVNQGGIIGFAYVPNERGEARQLTSIDVLMGPFIGLILASFIVFVTKLESVSSVAFFFSFVSINVLALAYGNDGRFLKNELRKIFSGLNVRIKHWVKGLFVNKYDELATSLVDRAVKYIRHRDQISAEDVYENLRRPNLTALEIFDGSFLRNNKNAKFDSLSQIGQKPAFIRAMKRQMKGRILAGDLSINEAFVIAQTYDLKAIDISDFSSLVQTQEMDGKFVVLPVDSWKERQLKKMVKRVKADQQLVLLSESGQLDQVLYKQIKKWRPDIDPWFHPISEDLIVQDIFYLKNLKRSLPMALRSQVADAVVVLPHSIVPDLSGIDKDPSLALVQIMLMNRLLKGAIYNIRRLLNLKAAALTLSHA